MDLFDYIKVIFDSKPTYEDLSTYDKTKNSFMLNRFMSIRYPIQANLFNTLGTNSLGAADSWRRVTSQFKRTPGWIFTKVKKSQSKQKESYVPSDEAVSMFMSINQIGRREFQECLKYNKETTISYLKILEKEFKNNAN
jgi:hypothetical protein